MIKILIIPILLLAIGCGDFNRFYHDKRAVDKADYVDPDVVAVIGDTQITQEALLKTLRSLPLNQRNQYMSSPEKKYEFLETYINQLVLAKEARKRGYDQREYFKDNVEQHKNRLLVQMLGQEVLSDADLSDRAVTNYYEGNKNEYEFLDVSEIYVKRPQRGVSDESVLGTTKQIAGRIAKGEDFEQVGRAYQEGSKGNIRLSSSRQIRKGVYPPDVEAQLFSLSPGEIIGPLELGNGYYIIKLKSRTEPSSLEQVRRSVESDMTQQHFGDYSKGLWDSWDVEIYKDNLEEIELK